MSEHAGRELDALVAEKVMGWTVRHGTDSAGMEDTTEVLDATGQTVLAGWGIHRLPDILLEHGHDELPPYSTDIAAAWQVWLKVTATDPLSWAIYSAADGEVEVEHFPAGYGGDLEQGTGDIQVSGPAPLAICLAAFKAVGAKVSA